MNQTIRNDIMETLSQYFPNPESALEFSNPFELLIGVVLAAQATDASVNIGTRRLFKDAGTPKAIYELGEDRLKTYIRHIGLYNAKAKNVVALCKILCEKYDGQVPEDFDALVQLPGVGRKSASVVMNVAFGHPFIAVDTHVFRVSNRTGYAKGKTPDQVQEKLERYTAKQYKIEAHHYFIYLGRQICKARKPECWRCPIEKYCEFKTKTPMPDEKTLAKRPPERIGSLLGTKED